jgi:hypothetical protein
MVCQPRAYREGAGSDKLAQVGRHRYLQSLIHIMGYQTQSHAINLLWCQPAVELSDQLTTSIPTLFKSVMSVLQLTRLSHELLLPLPDNDFTDCRFRLLDRPSGRPAPRHQERPVRGPRDR